MRSHVCTRFPARCPSRLARRGAGARRRAAGATLLAALLALPFAATAQSTGAAQATGDTDAAAAGDAAERPRVRLDTTLGDIVIELFPQQAPQTVDNFLRLVDQGFYEGLIFHRVVAGFVVQAGGYDAGMTYREPPGGVPNESSNGLANERGTVAMARLSDPDSANTQFYVNVADNEHLDARPGQPGYTVFGRVVEGMDVVTEIELADTTRKAGMAGVPETPIVIEDAQRL